MKNFEIDKKEAAKSKNNLWPIEYETFDILKKNVHISFIQLTHLQFFSHYNHNVELFIGKVLLLFFCHKI